MRAAFALRINSGKIILKFAARKNLRIFPSCFFTGKESGRERHVLTFIRKKGSQSVQILEILFFTKCGLKLKNTVFHCGPSRENANQGRPQSALICSNDK